MSSECLKYFKILIIGFIFLLIPNGFLFILAFMFFQSIKNLEFNVISILLTVILNNLNPQIFNIENDIITYFRYMLILILFFKIIKNNIKIEKKICFIIFGIYILINIISSIAYSRSITISISKLFIFTFLINLFISTAKNINYIDVGKKIYIFIISINIFNLLISLSENGYFFSYQGGALFEGIFSHPNTLGAINIVSVGYIILFGKIYKYKKNKVLNVILLLIIFYSSYISRARTSIFGVLIMIFIYLIINLKLSNKKIFFMMLSSIMIMFFIYIYKIEILEAINQILFKYDSENIFISRNEQINRSLNDFFNSPLIGSGFGVNNSDLSYYEKGNIILALLSESGIVGLILYTMYLIFFLLEYRERKCKYIIWPVIAILISNMGEMWYFSINGLGIINYFTMGFYCSIKHYHQQEIREVCDENSCS